VVFNSLSYSISLLVYVHTLVVSGRLGMYPFHMLGVADVFGGSLFSANYEYKFGQEGKYQISVQGMMTSKL